MSASTNSIGIEDIERLAKNAPLASGYRFDLLQRSEIYSLVEALEVWFPDISVGGASYYLDENFYARKVFFEDALDQDNLVLVLKHREIIVGMFSCELDRATQSVYAGLGVASPDHRGANLAQAGMMFAESLCLYLGMGFIFGMATLKHPYAQRAFERAGWQLIGITPGYDRELIAPGVVKRVYEAVYAKVFDDSCLQNPERRNLTPRTQALFDSVFGSESIAGSSRPSQSPSVVCHS
jgi:hypothetical protein